MSNKMKNKYLPYAVGVALALGCTVAQAVSLIDAAGTTAIQSGFTDLLDTIKNVLSISWPFMLGGMALMAAPSLVHVMFKKATSK